MSSTNVPVLVKDPRKVQQEKVLTIANTIGAKWAFVSGSIVGGAVVVATKNWRAFDKFLSISAKTSFPVMTAMAFYSYKYEMVMYDAQFHPERYGLPRLVLKPGEKELMPSSMPIHHRIINSFYDHPFRLLTAMAVPFGAVVWSKQLNQPHLKFQQKIMQSRVFIQFGVITMLLVTMGFKEYMDKVGRFEEPTAGAEHPLYQKGSDEQFEANSDNNSVVSHHH